MDEILVELKLQYLIIKDDHWEASRLNMFFPRRFELLKTCC